MARYNFADLSAWADATEAKMNFVMKSSITDVLVAAQTTQIGIGQGATSFVEGKIPVDTAELVNSLTVDGAEGPDAYVVAIAGMQLGDYERFGWTADHAHRIEVGFVGTDSLGRTYNQAGRHFVGKNAAKFSEFVAKRVAEVRS